VIDGTARSAEWREKQRADEQPPVPGSQEASPAPPAPDFDSAVAKDFVSSLMIPVDKLPVETRQEPAAPKPADAYISTLLDGARDRQATRELEVQAGVSSEQSDELDRWFEEQATSLPSMPAAQKLPAGSASLEIETAAADVKRARHVRALGLRRVRARESDEQRRGRTGRRRLPSGVRVTRITVGTMLAVCSVVAIVIAAGGSPVRRSPISSPRASTSTTFLGVLDTLMSKAGRLAGLESRGVHARPHPRPAQRTDHAARRRPIAHPAASTSVAPSRSYTPQLASQTDTSPAAAAAAAASSTSGGASSPPASTASSPAASSSSQTRTGPSGPISLIGAGTTPSG
jgi:hypothetical protein